MRALWLLCILTALASATLTLHFSNSELPLFGAQLWFRGNWTQIGDIPQTDTCIVADNATRPCSPRQVAIVFPGPHIDVRELRNYSLSGYRAIISIQYRKTLRVAPGGDMYFFDEADDTGVITPVYQVLLDTLDEYLAVMEAVYTEPVVFASLLDDTPNDVKVYRESMAVQVSSWCIFGYLCCIVLLFIQRFYGFATTRGLEFSIPQICIILDLISLFIKLIYLAIDPFYTRRYFSQYASNVFITIHYPFFLTACLLLVFYWYELGQNAKRVRIVASNKFLKVYRWPAFFFIGLVFVVEIIGQVLRQFNNNGANYTGVVYIVIMIFVSTIYMYSGIVLIRRINRMISKREAKQRVKKIASMVVCASVLLCVCIVITILVATPLYQLRQYEINLCLVSVSSTVALLHAISFVVRSNNSDSSRASRASRVTFSKS